MSGAPDFLRVPEHVARNPVARAVARQRVERAVRDYGVRLLLLDDGEACAADAMACAKVLMAAVAVADALGQVDSDGGRVLRDGLQRLVALSERGFVWQRADAGTLEHALDVAATLLSQAPAALVQGAWAECQRAEIRAERRATAAQEGATT